MTDTSDTSPAACDDGGCHGDTDDRGQTDDHGDGECHDREDGRDHDRGPTGRDTAGSDATTVEFAVPGMDCPSCAGKVENAVGGLGAVERIDPRPTAGRLSVAFDGERTDAAAVVDRIEAAGYAVEGRDRVGTATLSIPEMDCPSCAGKVETALDGLDGVDSADPRPATGRVAVDYDPGTTDVAALRRAVEGAGYPVEGVTEDDGGARGAVAPGESSVLRSRRAATTAVGGIALAAGLFVEWVAPGLNGAVASVSGTTFVLADVLFLLAVGVSGGAILHNGYYSARNLSLDIDFLMGAAIVSAVTASLLAAGTSLYVEAATLAVLFSVSELLERHSIDRTRNSLRELMELSPDEATVRRDGSEETVPVDEVRVGETVAVRPGEKVPVDGVVREGESAVDQSPITGESVPEDKAVGDEVYAGSVNEGGYLAVETTATAGEDTLSQVVDLVEEAQANRTEREQFVERFASYYTPLMVGVAVLVAAVPPLLFGAPWATWFVAGITMLVLACPCAFVISTPVSVVSGITSAARNGVLIKGGPHLEAMGAVETVALDKTGTLTKGELTVTDVVPLGDRTEAEVLRCARGVEVRSEHPIGEAIVAHADGTEIEGREVADFESLTGKGVRATLDGTTHYAGKPGLFDDLGFDLGHVHVDGPDGQLAAEVRDRCVGSHCLDLVEDTIPRLRAEGKTVVLVGREDELEGLVAVADEVRPGARRTVAALRDLGIETVMLTGDSERTARAIAAEVGVDDYRAELLPDEKVAAVEELLAERDAPEDRPWWRPGGREGGVAMVGDGVNDAPALAAATVGIAMGAAGTDAALETADVALMGDDLSRLPYVAELSRDANGVIRQNVWASLAVKALLAVGVPFGYVSVALAVLVGDAGMTVGVTGNAMRLARVTPDGGGGRRRRPGVRRDTRRSRPRPDVTGRR